MEMTPRSFDSRSVAMMVMATAFVPVASLIAASVPATPPVSLGQIVAALEQTEYRKQHDLQAYTSIRRYVLKNERFNQDAEMMVKMDFTSEKGKHFEILSEHGTEGMSRHLLRKVLDGEAETSRT